MGFDMEPSRQSFINLYYMKEELLFGLGSV